MFGLVVGALWRRRAQAALLFVLAVVATTGAAAAPVYIVGSIQSLAATALAGAPVPERVVAVDGHTDLSGDPAAALRSFHDQGSRELDLPGFTKTPSLGIQVSFDGGQGVAPAGRIDYRDDLCEHVSIQGACPTAAREIVLSQTLAAQLRV